MDGKFGVRIASAGNRRCSRLPVSAIATSATGEFLTMSSDPETKAAVSKLNDLRDNHRRLHSPAEVTGSVYGRLTHLVVTTNGGSPSTLRDSSVTVNKIGVQPKMPTESDPLLETCGDPEMEGPRVTHSPASSPSSTADPPGSIVLTRRPATGGPAGHSVGRPPRSQETSTLAAPAVPRSFVDSFVATVASLDESVVPSIDESRRCCASSIGEGVAGRDEEEEAFLASQQKPPESVTELLQRMFTKEARQQRRFESLTLDAGWASYWGSLDEMKIMIESLLGELRSATRCRDRLQSEVDGLRSSMHSLKGSTGAVVQLMEKQQREIDGIRGVDTKRLESLREDNDRLIVEADRMRHAVAVAESANVRAQQIARAAEVAAARSAADLETALHRQALEVAQLRREVLNAAKVGEGKLARLEYLEGDVVRTSDQCRLLSKSLEIVTLERDEQRAKLASIEHGINEVQQDIDASMSGMKQAAGMTARDLQQMTLGVMRRREEELHKQIAEVRTTGERHKRRSIALPGMLSRMACAYEGELMTLLDIDALTGASGVTLFAPRVSSTMVVPTAQSSILPASRKTKGRKGAAVAQPVYVCGPFVFPALSDVAAQKLNESPGTTADPDVDLRRCMVQGFTTLFDRLHTAIEGMWEPIHASVPSDSANRPTGRRETLHALAQTLCRVADDAASSIVQAYFEALPRRDGALANERRDAQAQLLSERAKVLTTENKCRLRIDQLDRTLQDKDLLVRRLEAAASKVHLDVCNVVANITAHLGLPINGGRKSQGDDDRGGLMVSAELGAAIAELRQLERNVEEHAGELTSCQQLPGSPMSNSLRLDASTSSPRNVGQTRSVNSSIRSGTGNVEASAPAASGTPSATATTPKAAASMRPPLSSSSNLAPGTPLGAESRLLPAAGIPRAGTPQQRPLPITLADPPKPHAAEYRAGDTQSSDAESAPRHDTTARSVTEVARPLESTEMLGDANLPAAVSSGIRGGLPPVVSAGSPPATGESALAQSACPELSEVGPTAPVNTNNANDTKSTKGGARSNARQNATVASKNRVVVLLNPITGGAVKLVTPSSSPSSPPMPIVTMPRPATAVGVASMTMHLPSSTPIATAAASPPPLGDADGPVLYEGVVWQSAGAARAAVKAKYQSSSSGKPPSSRGVHKFH